MVWRLTTSFEAIISTTDRTIVGAEAMKVHDFDKDGIHEIFIPLTATRTDDHSTTEILLLNYKNSWS